MSTRKSPYLLAFVFLSALATRAAAETPHVLVPNGVTDFSLGGAKVFWHTWSGCLPGLDGAWPANPQSPEVLRRIAAAGSNTRTLFSHNPPHPDYQCNPYAFLSRVLADNDFVYWVDETGLVRLSVEANIGDPTELLSSAFQGDPGRHPLEVAQDASFIYAIERASRGGGSRVWKVSKDDGESRVLSSPSTVARQVASDGQYAYWIDGGNLARYRLQGGRGFPQSTIASNGITAFYAEGRKNQIFGNASHFVFFARGRRLYRYNNIGGVTSPALYTSELSGAEIYSIRSLGGNLISSLGAASGIYFFEKRKIPCTDCIFSSYTQHLYRIPRGGGEGDLLYLRDTQLPIDVDAHHLAVQNGYLFWQDLDRVLRLPADAEALPKTNMRVTGLEVTQGIQDLNHSVRLIEDRRTFVRVYVRSDDPNHDVAGVRCQLRGAWSGGSGGPLTSVNSTGSTITVQANPDREDIDQSFLFELPLSWTRQTNLTLTAKLNPHKSPPQESYANNTFIATPAFNFDPSPRLQAQFVAFKYEWGNTEYSPSYYDDVLPTYSWIRRVYPLSSVPGDMTDGSPGFRPNLWYVFDDDLGAKVNQTDDDCLEMDKDDRNLCASAYTNSRLAAWQDDQSASHFYYGMISDGLKFPRGQAASYANVSSGPAGSPGGWDTDSTYADWYAGHEIGHSIGRGHPMAASDDPDTEAEEGCKHIGSDANYPHMGALIGPSGGSLMGFDVGDSKLPRAVLPRDLWSDMMSYCDYQWISDYNYEAIYNSLMASGGGAGAGAGGGGAVVRVPGVRLPVARVPVPRVPGVRVPVVRRPEAGDSIGVYGTILPERGKAVIHHVRRIPRATTPRTGGRKTFSLELLDGAGTVLDAQPFAAQTDDDAHASALPFGVTMPFSEGTRTARVVDVKAAEILAEIPLSPNAPTISKPETSKDGGAKALTLTWDAADADGDNLCYDVLYRRSGDVFRPLCFNLKQTTCTVDTSTVGGGLVVFRVVASDGVHSAEAESAAVEIEAKPPVPRIITPIDDMTIEYGQLINFVGVADDLQDGAVAASGLRWTVPGTRDRRGASFSSDTLPVGLNEITLVATSSLGLSASTTVHVRVHDDLLPPGATLSVSPAQLGWHLSGPTSRRQTRTIGVANVGGGSALWTATVDVDWLSLSATSGSTPATVTLTANPGGLPEGTTETATVVFTQTNGEELVIPVHVSLAIAASSYTGPLETDGPDGEPGGRFRRGDSNNDGVSDISDALHTLNFLFNGGRPPHCNDAADFDDTGSLGISDAIAELDFLFFGRPPSPAPGPWTCGEDPTADDFAACEGPCAAN